MPFIKNMALELNNKKRINAWCMYDWANSVYSLVITSTIFPVYYNNVTEGVDGNDVISFFGVEIVNTVLYSYSLSFSFLLIAIISPFLSGIADYAGKKKTFMQIFTYLGSLACAGLYFFEGPNVEWGIICSVLASIGYSGSLVFYNSFLPEIATSDKFDRISAKGFSLGYIGSVLLLIVNLLMLSKPEWFNLSGGGQAAKISFLMVGIWWAGFSQYTFYHLPSNPYNKRVSRGFIYKGYKELKGVWRIMQHLPSLKVFLFAFFFFNMGVQTVMYLAATFGDKVLRLPGDKLILTILIIQIVGVLGSFLFAYISDRKGNIFSLNVMLVIWIGICIAAYYVQIEYEFYLLAFVVGLVMGGIQALSRSTYAKLIPTQTTDHASFFSFYDVMEKLSLVFGTFAYGLIEQITGDMRNSTIALALFFVTGMIFLQFVKVPKYRGEETAKAA
jgi:MFS transporter, UMF1 family